VLGYGLCLLRFNSFEILILQGISEAKMTKVVYYVFILKRGFYCVTFQKEVAKLPGFAIINTWQHFGNRKSASHNK